MAKSKAQKQQLKTEVGDQLKKVNAAIIAEYSGLTVADLTELRVKLREAKSEFHVVKNRIAKVAVKEDAPNAAPLKDILKGPVGIVFVYGDPAAAAKAVLAFAKDKEKFKVIGGVLDGTGVKAAELQEIADLPSREQMLSQIAGLIQSQAQRLHTVISALPRDVVQVIFNLSEKKS